MSSINQLEKYSLEEVSRHNTTSDCWIVINDRVYNVTDFLSQHPGGASAISKPGRGGSDVTKAFERIGHSEKANILLKKMEIGYINGNDNENSIDKDNHMLDNLEYANESQPLIHDSPPPQGFDDQDHAIEWHATRRSAILKDHPEIANLLKPNPWTPLIGLGTVIVHCMVCLYVQQENVSWYFTIALAYTIGAMCKMYQFSVNHDICHGSAGTWLDSSSLLKRSAMQILTLPSIGGAMHTYYEFQHLGHHASLGAQAFSDFSIANDTKFDFLTLRKMPFFPDGDGDLFAIGNFSYGRILESWGIRLGHELVKPRKYVGMNADYSFNQHITYFHRTAWLKCIVIQAGHVFHHASLAGLLASGIALPLPIALIGFIFPETSISLVKKFLDHYNLNNYDKATPQALDLMMSLFIAGLISVGLHAWLWIGLTIYLLFFVNPVITIYSVFKGFLYLYLSELFLYGFAMHPYMGYFLGVHRSGGKGFESTGNVKNSNGCQPTMSTYSIWSAFCSLNLTHHVEHHDFPTAPWNNLPLITKLAPEYYEGLEYSPGFTNTIFRWIQHSEGWGYACH